VFEFLALSAERKHGRTRKDQNNRRRTPQVVSALPTQLNTTTGSKEVSLLNYAAAIFPSIENTDAPAKIKTIAAAYRNLKDESGDFYKNLKLMDERLSELLEPIRNTG
jgi:hypothetical protein